MRAIGITGHQTIPENALFFIKEGIAKELSLASRVFTGISSLAKGADQLFAETVLEMGGRLHVIIPCLRYESTFGDGKPLKNFLKLLERANIVETLNHTFPSERAFLEAGKRVVDLSEVLIAVWDGRKARGKGGTADIVFYARQHGTKIIVVWPQGIDR